MTDYRAEITVRFVLDVGEPSGLEYRARQNAERITYEVFQQSFGRAMAVIVERVNVHPLPALDATKAP
jgi:hypothetical protein